MMDQLCSVLHYLHSASMPKPGLAFRYGFGRTSKFEVAGINQSFGLVLGIKAEIRTSR